MASYFRVHQILKAVAGTRPKEKKLLVSCLARGTKNLSLFELSIPTAGTLLLATGKRIHDLTLLNIPTDHLINLNE